MGDECCAMLSIVIVVVLFAVLLIAQLKHIWDVLYVTGDFVKGMPTDVNGSLL